MHNTSIQTAKQNVKCTSVLYKSTIGAHNFKDLIYKDNKRAQNDDFTFKITFILAIQLSLNNMVQKNSLKDYIPLKLIPKYYSPFTSFKNEN